MSRARRRRWRNRGRAARPPVGVGAPDPTGIALGGGLPPGGRRAGVLAHRYEAKLIGLESRQYTGWLAAGRYAPHTEGGFRAPANKTLLLLANGFVARRGLRRARALGRTEEPRRSGREWRGRPRSWRMAAHGSQQGKRPHVHIADRAG